MGAFARLHQKVLGAPGDNLFTEGGERLDHVLEVHQLRTAARQRNHVAAEGRLQRREAVDLIEHHVGHRIAPELDHDAHALAVGFVADVGDALDALVAHQLGDLLDHRGLVHLIRDLGDDQGLTVLADLLDLDLAAHGHRAAACVIGRLDAGTAEDQAAGREVRTRDQFDQFVDGDVRPLDLLDTGIDNLAQIVRRNVGRHADRDAAGAVDQEVRNARRQDLGFGLGVVVVLLEIDRVLVDVLEQRVRRLAHAHLGVAHGRRGIAVDRAEIALAVEQRQAQGEVLRHADKGVVDRLIAVRVVLTDDVADHAGRLAVGLVPVVPVFVHRIEDAPVDGLKAVAHVRQGAADDHAHGVIEITALHLLFDGDRGYGAVVGPFPAVESIVYVRHIGSFGQPPGGRPLHGFGVLDLVT